MAINSIPYGVFQSSHRSRPEVSHKQSQGRVRRLEVFQRARRLLLQREVENRVQRGAIQLRSLEDFWRLLLRGTIVNRTYRIDKNLYIQQLLLTIFGPIYYGPP